MINLNEIKVEDILKKGDNLLIIAVVLVGLVISLRINANNSKAANLLKGTIDAQKSAILLISDIKVIVKDYQAYRNEIFFDKDSAKVVNLINDWARESGVELISLRPLFLKDAEQFLNMPIALEAKSDYFSLGQFLSRIESYKGFFEIVSLRIFPEAKAQTGQTSADRVKFTLSLNAVILKDLKASGLAS